MSYVLPVACSTDTEPLLRSLEEDFNSAWRRGGEADAWPLAVERYAERDLPRRQGDSTGLAIECRFHEDESLISGAVTRDFPVLVPSSNFSMHALRRQWEERYGTWNDAVTAVPFAKSPVVFSMSEETYEALGGDSAAIGWHTLSEEPSLRIAHAHGTKADGLAILSAAWSWAAGGQEISPGMTEIAHRVSAIEARVAEYAPDDRSSFSLFHNANVVVAQERAALAVLPGIHSRSVIVYPDEGTLWVEQVVARVHSAHMSASEQIGHAYGALNRHLQSPRGTAIIQRAGLQPVGTRAPGPHSASAQAPAALNSGGPGNVLIVNRGASPMRLPGYNSVRVISDEWAGVARPVDICLVLDCSSSMHGGKLAAAGNAVRKFCARTQSTATRLSLVTFSDSARVTVAPMAIAAARPAMELALNAVTANGMTALFDATTMAVAELQHARDPNRLQAIVLLTDGQENNSRASLEGTLRATADIELVFGIAFGADANIETLRQLARAPERAMRASVDDIDKIYDLLSMKM